MFVYAYYNTSQAINVQRALLVLHNLFDLTGMMDQAHLDTIQGTVGNYQPIPDPSAPPAPTSTYPEIPSENMVDPSLHAPQPPASQSPPQGLPPAQPIISCHPPNLVYKLITDRHPGWLYECDECGHRFLYRTELLKHFRQQGSGFRDGFRLVSALPATAPVWYAIDTDGNQYQGTMLANDPGARSPSRLPEPCASRKKRAAAEKKAKEENEEEEKK